jgi:hypothetical protein
MNNGVGYKRHRGRKIIGHAVQPIQKKGLTRLPRLEKSPLHIHLCPGGDGRGGGQ